MIAARDARPRFWLFRFALAAALAATAGCSGSNRPPESSAPAAAGAPPAREARAEPREADEDALSRSALHAALDRGPGAFLQGIEVEAHFEGGAFAGWRVVGLGAQREPFEDAGIRVGDVVTAVNGYALERPEYLHTLFLELRGASAILVEGTRAGEPFELRIPIVDEIGEPDAPADR